MIPQLSTLPNLHIIISSPLLVNHIIKVAQCQPIWNQIFFQHPRISFTLPLPIESTSSRFQHITLDSQKMFFIPWIYYSQQYSPILQSCYSHTYWLILDEYFFISTPEYDIFWMTFGNYIITTLNYISKKHETSPLIFCSTYLVPSRLQQSIQHLPFSKLEFLASCSIFHTNWLIHTGLWLPVYRGKYLEWIIRGSAMLLKLQQSNPPLYHKRAQQIFVKHAFKVQYHFKMPQRGFMIPFIEEMPIPHKISNEWDNWTLNSILQLYSTEKWMLEKNTDWVHIWNPWDVTPTISPPVLPRILEKMFLPSHPLPLTVAINGCLRPEILSRTIQSFLNQWIDYPKFEVKWLIHIDGNDTDDYQYFRDDIETQYPKIKTLHTKYFLSFKQKGFAKSFIDIMKEVETNLVFYLQDDWEFLTPFMMEQLIREIMPFSSLKVGAHLFKTDLGNNNNHLIHLSPSIFKTYFVRQWIHWCESGEYPLNIFRDKTPFHEKGGLHTKLKIESVCCSLPGKFHEMVRDIGRPWLKANNIIRNDVVKNESFDKWIW